MRYARYSVFAPPAKLQDVCDALNAPRNPEDDATDAGLGPNTCRDDATTYPGLDDKPVESPPNFRWFTLSVRPSDTDRFEATLDGFSGVRYATYHPTGADGSEHRRAAEHFQANDLKRVPDE